MLVLAQVMPAAFEVLDDLFNRLRTEVRDRGKLGFGLGQQLADRLDAGPLEAVVRTDAELEFVDQDVVVAAGGNRVSALGDGYFIEPTVLAGLR